MSFSVGREGKEGSEVMIECDFKQNWTSLIIKVFRFDTNSRKKEEVKNEDNFR